MNDCPVNEKPSSILNDAHDYVKQVNTQKFATVQAETALNLAQAAYANSGEKPGDNGTNLAAARQLVADNSGLFGIGADSRVQSNVAIELAQAARFDKLKNPDAAGLS